MPDDATPDLRAEQEAVHKTMVEFLDWLDEDPAVDEDDDERFVAEAVVILAEDGDGNFRSYSNVGKSRTTGLLSRAFFSRV